MILKAQPGFLPCTWRTVPIWALNASAVCLPAALGIRGPPRFRNTSTLHGGSDFGLRSRAPARPCGANSPMDISGWLPVAGWCVSMVFAFLPSKHLLNKVSRAARCRTW